MSAAQVTEAHRRLVRLISWAGISGKQVEEKAQLIADSEARALSAHDATYQRACEVEHQLRVSAQTWEAAANAHLSRAEQAEAKLHALRLVCGTDDANKFETWCDRAIARAQEAESAQLDSLASCEMAVARAEKAEARIAELETANRELLHALKVIAGMWIADTTPLAPPDALAERMGKLALAATLRKHP